VGDDLKKLGVSFDVTRQAQADIEYIQNGSGTLTYQATKKFPFLDGKDNELPNDDTFSTDEQNTPSPKSGLLYSFDAPGVPVKDTRQGSTIAFSVMRTWFKEWVRVKLDGKPFLNQGVGHNTQAVEGSRVSDKVDWHAVVYLKRTANETMDWDTTGTTADDPSFIGVGAQGTVSVSPLANAVTEGFTATFNNGTNKWTLTGTSGDTTTAALVGGQWTLTIGTKVTVVITPPAMGNFDNGVKYIFSSFKTGSSKKNEIALGSFTDVTGDTKDVP
jgi:hypothetical protein